MQPLPYQSVIDNGVLFASIERAPGRLTVAWPVPTRSAQWVAAGVHFVIIVFSAISLGLVPFEFAWMSLVAAPGTGRVGVWVTYVLRCGMAVNLVTSVWMVAATVWTLSRWYPRGRVLTVADGRVTLEWLGPWGPRRRWRPTAAIVGVEWKRPRRVGRRRRLVQRVTIRFRKGRPIRFALTGPAIEAVRDDLTAVLTPATGRTD